MIGHGVTESQSQKSTINQTTHRAPPQRGGTASQERQKHKPGIDEGLDVSGVPGPRPIGRQSRPTRDVFLPGPLCISAFSVQTFPATTTPNCDRDGSHAPSCRHMPLAGRSVVACGRMQRHPQSIPRPQRDPRHWFNRKSRDEFQPESSRDHRRVSAISAGWPLGPGCSSSREE